MVIREEKKMLKGEKLSKEQKTDYRRKKLVEIRKGKGPGRPFQMRSKTHGTFNNPATQAYLNELRDKDILALQTRMEEYKLENEGKLD
jgi:cytochrome c553